MNRIRKLFHRRAWLFPLLALVAGSIFWGLAPTISHWWVSPDSPVYRGKLLSYYPQSFAGTSKITLNLPKEAPEFGVSFYLLIKRPEPTEEGALAPAPERPPIKLVSSPNTTAALELWYQPEASQVEGRLNQRSLGKIALEPNQWALVELMRQKNGVWQWSVQGKRFARINDPSLKVDSLQLAQAEAPSLREVALWRGQIPLGVLLGERQQRLQVFMRLLGLGFLGVGLLPWLVRLDRLASQQRMKPIPGFDRIKKYGLATLGLGALVYLARNPEKPVRLFGVHPLGQTMYPELQESFQVFFGVMVLLFAVGVFIYPSNAEGPRELRFGLRVGGFLGVSLGLLFVACLVLPPALYNIYQLSDNQYPISFLSDLSQIHWSSIKPWYFIGLTLNWMVACLLGLVLAPALYAKMDRSIGVKVMAAFVLGYPAVIFWTRLWSLVFGGNILYIVVLSSILGLIYWRRGTVVQLARQSPRGHSGELVFSLILWASLLTLQISQGDFYYAGHGDQYSRLVDRFAQVRLPIFGQHYDHILYNSFATKPLTGHYPALLSHWYTLSLAKVAVFWQLLLLFEWLGLERRLAWVGTIFLFWGTSSLVPWSYYLQFDSGNPLYFIAYSGRVVGIGLAATLICLKLKNLSLHPASWALILAGCAALSVSVGLWLLVLMFPVVVLIKRDRMWIGLIILATLLSFGLDWEQLGILIRSAMVFCILLVLLRGAAVGRFYLRQPRAFLIGALALITAMATLGNMPSNFLRHQVNQILANDGLVEERIFPPLGYHPLFSEGFDQGGVFRAQSISDFRAHGGWTVYHESLPIYLSTSGMLLLFMGFFLFFRRRADLTARYYFVMSAVSLPLLYFFANNSVIGVYAWPKTRLFEVPYFLVLFLAIVQVARCRRRIKQAMVVFMLLYSFTPFLATERIGQMVENLKYVRYNYQTYR